jgi:hypothetical protein
MIRKVKIAESIEKHKDVEVRLAASFLQSAIAHAKKGDLIRMAACIRLASDYERAIPSETKLELRTNG